MRASVADGTITPEKCAAVLRKRAAAAALQAAKPTRARRPQPQSAAAAAQPATVDVAAVVAEAVRCLVVEVALRTDRYWERAAPAGWPPPHWALTKLENCRHDEPINTAPPPPRFGEHSGRERQRCAD